MSFKAPKYTAAGRALHNRLVGAGKPLTFTKMQMGDGYLGAATITDLTALVSPKASMDISKMNVGTEFVTATAPFTNTGLTSAFLWREIGLFAADPDYPADRTRDILFCYQNAGDTAELIPPGAQSLLERTVNLPMRQQDVANVTFAVSTSLLYALLDPITGKLEDSVLPETYPTKQEAKGYAEAAKAEAITAAGADATAKSEAAKATSAADATAKSDAAQEAAKTASVPLASKGAAGGVAPLGADGMIPLQHIPEEAKEQRVVANIAARDAIGKKFVGLSVYVKDATADPTVKRGGAYYLWDGAWNKTAEAESMDVSLTWDNVEGKPATFPPGGHSHTPEQAGLGKTLTFAGAATGTFNGAADKTINIPEAGGKRTCRFVVGTSTSGWTAKDCDYLCDGTDDQVEINAAIQALPATGGEVVILDGTYITKVRIDVNRDNICICGNGKSTIITCKGGYSPSVGAIYITANACTVKDITVSGNGSSGVTSSGNNTCVSGCTFSSTEAGVYIIGGSQHLIINNYATGCSDGGIRLSSLSFSVVSGNICVWCSDSGILVGGSNSCEISGNVLYENFVGILISGTASQWSSNRHCITGNICIHGTGQASDYSGTEQTIFLKGAYNNYHLIADNNIMGKNYVCEGGTGNTFVNNKYN